jgi:hypothetical protein
MIALPILLLGLPGIVLIERKKKKREPAPMAPVPA